MADSTSLKPHVLAVDDEEHITELVAMALGINGFDVERVSSGRAALAAIDARRPDLVLLDVMLPDLDGFEVCRRMRQDGERVPVLFLTARDAIPDRVRGLDAGADDYLCKPFAFEELLARVRALARRPARQTSRVSSSSSRSA